MQMKQTFLILGLNVLLACLSASGFAQLQSARIGPAQTNLRVAELSLEESSNALAFGKDGMLYIVSSYGGRYRKGTLSRLNPEAFSRLRPAKDGRSAAANDDFTEVYTFRESSEMLDKRRKEFGNCPSKIIAGADGKLYISGGSQLCARFDVDAQLLDWVAFAPETIAYGERNFDLQNTGADCFAVTSDGLLLCKRDGSERAAVFHTRGGNTDLGAIAGTEGWKDATLANDGYVYGATDDALVRVKTDGSGIAILKAFTGKDDHPVGAPVLVRNTLYGYAADAGARMGYIYRLNPDGSGYSILVSLDYTPSLPLVAGGDFAYGIGFSPVRSSNSRSSRTLRNQGEASLPEIRGLFRIGGDAGKFSVIVPAKEPPRAQALVVGNSAAYVLKDSNPASILRVPIPGASGASAVRSAEQHPALSSPATGVGDGRAVASNPEPPAPPAPVPGGKSFFHKRQSSSENEESLTAGEGRTEGNPPSGGGEGIPARVRPGLAPRKATASTRLAPAAPETTEEDTSPAPEQPTESWGDSSSSTHSSGSWERSHPSGRRNPLVRTSRRGGTGNEAEAPDSSAGATDTSAIVDQQMQAMSAQDTETLSSLYGNNVDYLDKGVVSNEAVRNDLQDYFDRWPVTQWQVAGAVSSKELAGGNYQITFPVTFNVSNPRTGRHISGVALQTEVITTDSAGNMKIISRHEKVSRSRDNSSRQKPKGDKVYQGRRVNPSPPNVPWPLGIPRP